VFVGAECALLIIAMLSFIVPTVHSLPPLFIHLPHSWLSPTFIALVFGIHLLALLFDILVPSSSAPPSPPVGSGLQAGWCCDVALAVLWYCCSCLGMEPFATL